MTPNTLFLDIARLRNQERLATAERKSSLVRTPMNRLRCMVRRPDHNGTRRTEEPQVDRAA